MLIDSHRASTELWVRSIRAEKRFRARQRSTWRPRRIAPKARAAWRTRRRTHFSKWQVWGIELCAVAWSKSYMAPT